MQVNGKEMQNGRIRKSLNRPKFVLDETNHNFEVTVMMIGSSWPYDVTLGQDDGLHQRWARLWSRDWDWDQGGLSLGLKLWDQKDKVSVSVSKFETDLKSLSLSLKFWD